MEAQARREQEKLKAEEKARKKEDERQRRATILEQHKVKKAIEEAEREVCVCPKFSAASGILILVTKIYRFHIGQGYR